MSGMEPVWLGPTVILGTLAVATAAAFAGFHLLAWRRWISLRTLVVVALVGFAVAAVLLVAEAMRVMLLPDGQNEEGALVGLAVGLGAGIEAAILRRRAKR